MAKALPYTLTFLAGACVFWLSFARPSVWSAWLVEISGALSAIPIVFLIYEYSNYKMSSRVDKALFDNLSFEINSVMLKTLRFFHDALGSKRQISWSEIEKMLLTTRVEIKKKLKLGRGDVQTLRMYKEKMNDLVYRAADSGVLGAEQFAVAAAIPRELSRLINELEFRGNRDELTDALGKLFKSIDDWFDLCEDEALKSHSHFKLMESVGTPSSK